MIATKQITDSSNRPRDMNARTRSMRRTGRSSAEPGCEKTKRASGSPYCVPASGVAVS
jgi:hypothetical protein